MSAELSGAGAGLRPEHHLPAEGHGGRFFGGLQMIVPGLCDVASWRDVPGLGRPGRTLFHGGIGRKPC